MMKKLTAVCLLCLSFIFSWADTFTVTSNADSGPGTLRGAITQANANGSSTTDFIYFNIADISVTGRTIALQSLLPDLVSNLVIDGSTQPGGKIGVSDAKIRITGGAGIRLDYVFRIIDQKNFSFFGLHIDNIIPPTGNFLGGVAIAVMNADSIVIGGLGQGNYFTNLQAVIREADLQRPGRGIVNGLYIRSNILNLSEDGNSIVSHALLFALDNLRNLELGGENEGEGNFISNSREYIAWTYTDTFAHVNLGTYKILNNKLGCNYAQTTALQCGSIYLRNGNYYNYTDTTNIIIKNNSFNSKLIVGTNWSQNFIKLENKKGFIDIKSNKVGLLNADQQYFYSNILSAFIIGSCENGIIGGDNYLDSNIIAGCRGYAIALGNNKAIKISKNSIYCNSNGIKISSSLLPVPKTKISVITDYDVQGTTLPNSKVEVFLTKLCAGCDNGKTYLGTVNADASGNWNFTSSVLLDGAVTATGTTLQNNSSEFAKPEYEFGFFQTKNPTCNQNNGYIKGIKFVAGTRYYWLRTYMAFRDTIFTEEILNAGPGTYKFVVEQGKYCSVTYTVSLSDMSPKINSQFKNIVHPSCGLNNGSITNHSLSGSYNKILWKDASGVVVSTTSDLRNVGPGQYKMIILDTTYGCGDSTQFYTLTNQAGPSLNLSLIQIIPATCSSNSGSITGITANNITGTPFLQWVDSLNRPVSNNYNLQNVPPGKYRFKFKDASNCDTIITSFYVVGNLGEITIDITNKIIQPAKCTGNTGSILNIVVTGGNSYEWKNSSGVTVSNNLNVTNLRAGNYQLTVTNSLGCSKTSPLIVVPQATFIPISVQAWGSAAANCGKPNGNINAQTFNRDTSLYAFRWVDSIAPQITLSGYTKLRGIYGGTYILFAKDTNGCEQQIFKHTIINLPVPYFDYSLMQISPDECLSGKGSINGIVVKDMRGGSGTYVWLNTNNDSISNTLNIQNLNQGVYRLQATDLIGCTVLSQPLNVGNNNISLPDPQYENLTILKNTPATLKVKNNRSGTYQLFDDAAATTLVDQNATGTFITSSLNADKLFYLRYINGVCSSKLVAVKVTVVDKTAIYVPTAFTPNNDGKNDELKAIAYGKLKLTYFTIYNRWGQVVFSTSNFNSGWKGMVNGKPADTGVFVWIIKAQDELTGKWIEEKGTITVIR